MNIISFEEFEKMFAEQGIEISQSQYDMLDKYAHILVEYNNVMNLTGITDPMGISEKHFLDSLLIFKYCDIPQNGRVIDVGTGAGFPGVPMKIYRHDLDVTLLDSLMKRVKFLEAVAAETLPAGYGYEFGGMSREEASTGSSTTIIFVICIVFIYLILCALYESLFVPIAVILSVPFGLAGSFLFAKMFGLENNIYLQIGLLMLIGLLAKTAILLTEYASERRRQGMSISQAAVSAAQVRLRPILMTSLTMIFGMLPLMFASGVGANGNISIGVGTVGGMLIGTVALLFIVPVLFIIFQYLQERFMPERQLPKLEKKD